MNSSYTIYYHSIITQPIIGKFRQGDIGALRLRIPRKLLLFEPF